MLTQPGAPLVPRCRYTRLAPAATLATPRAPACRLARCAGRRTATAAVPSGDGGAGGAGDDAADVSSGDVFGELLSAQLSAEIQRRRGLLLFEAELAKEDDQVDVARAALYIALHHVPDLDVDAYVARLDVMGRELETFLPPPDERYTRRMLLAINAYMYDHLGFKGAPSGSYYSVANSCLNTVLDTRVGIPLTLCAVYMELARRVRLPMVGINLPAHFMCRPAVEDIEVLVDAYNGGEIISVEDAEALLSPLYGTDAKVELDRSFFLDNAPKPRLFLTRMLTNLKAREGCAGIDAPVQHDCAAPVPTGRR
jgi:regulator of sirC expression with transglutaminase-like and TPR domain